MSAYGSSLLLWCMACMYVEVFCGWKIWIGPASCKSYSTGAKKTNCIFFISFFVCGHCVKPYVACMKTSVDQPVKLCSV